MTFWLGVLIGCISSFVISFGCIIGWWFLIVSRNAEKDVNTEFRKVREAIRQANAGRLE